MAFSYSALTNLLAEDGRDDLLDQIDNETVIVDWKMPEGGRKNPQKVFEKMLRLSDRWCGSRQRRSVDLRQR